MTVKAMVNPTVGQKLSRAKARLPRVIQLIEKCKSKSDSAWEVKLQELMQEKQELERFIGNDGDA